MTLCTPLLLRLALAFLVKGNEKPMRLGVDYSTYYSEHLRRNRTLQHLSMVALRDTNVSRVKIFDTGRSLIEDLSQVWGLRSLHLMIGVANRALPTLARGGESFQPEALKELIETVSLFSHRIEFIAVGNEMDYPEINTLTVAPWILPVLETLHSALLERSLGHVRLTTPFSDMLIPDSIAIVGPSSVNMFPEFYDSSQGCNSPSCWDHHPVPLRKWISPVLNFFNRTNGVFTMSTYAFFKWRDLAVGTWCQRFGPCENVSLAFAVGAPDAEPLMDRVTGLAYTSLTAVMVDAIRFGLTRMGYPTMDFILTEAGWPTGGLGDPRANAVAACHFTNSLAALVNTGTPGFPGVPLAAYLFQWVDESLKWEAWGRPDDPGRIENHWGVLDSDLQPKYAVDWADGKAICPTLPGESTVRLSTKSSSSHAMPIVVFVACIASFLICVLTQLQKTGSVQPSNLQKEPLLSDLLVIT